MYPITSKCNIFENFKLKANKDLKIKENKPRSTKGQNPGPQRSCVFGHYQTDSKSQHIISLRTDLRVSLILYDSRCKLVITGTNDREPSQVWVLESRP